MTERMNVTAPIEYPANGEKKTYWLRCGVAFKTKSGDGWNVILDAVPCAKDGQVKLLLQPPRDFEERGGGSQRRGNDANSWGASPSDNDEEPPPF